MSKFDLGCFIETGAGYVINNDVELFSSLMYRESLTIFSKVKFSKLKIINKVLNKKTDPYETKFFNHLTHLFPIY